MQITELTWVPERGGDVPINVGPAIDFKDCTTEEQAARKLHKHLKAVCEIYGTPPENVYLWSPTKSEKQIGCKCWSVCWEEGPFEWAVGCFIDGPFGYGEPYNSFIMTLTN